MNRQKYGIFLLLLLISTLANAANAQLQNIKVLVAQQKTRIVFTLSAPVHYHVATLFHPSPQLIVALPNTQLGHKVNYKNLTRGIIAKVHIENAANGTLRVIFNLTTAKFHQILEIKTDKQKGEEVLIELSHEETSGKNLSQKSNNSKELALAQTENWVQETLPVQSVSNQKTTPANSHMLTDDMINTDDTDDVLANANVSNTLQMTAPSNLPQPVVKPAPANTVNSAAKGRQIVIVIDPGHGGKDPGTTGPLGIHEKDVVLAISHYLYQALAKDPNFKPTLTRTSDYFIPLRGRLAIARKDKGDMFVAIHADAYKDPYATGVAIFALSAHGASSEAARWLAEKENYSELGDVSLSGLTDKSDILRSVLIDLSQTATISASLQLGTSMLQQLGKISNLHYHHVEQAPFMVLKSPDIPSLLVETGFLSSPTEERRLHDPAYQQKLAQALYQGIRNYFWLNPPPETLVANLKQSNKHNA